MYRDGESRYPPSRLNAPQLHVAPALPHHKEPRFLQSADQFRALDLRQLIGPRLANAAGETPTVRGINEARANRHRL